MYCIPAVPKIRWSGFFSHAHVKIGLYHDHIFFAVVWFELRADTLS